MARILTVEMDLERFEQFRAENESAADVVATTLADEGIGWPRVLWTKHKANVGIMRIVKTDA